jgi:ABC-type lipoprotein release transport system permease subunit
VRTVDAHAFLVTTYVVGLFQNIALKETLLECVVAWCAPVFSYALNRVLRSLGLFIALLLGVVLASSFFTGINIGADTTAKAALNQQLSQVLVDLTASGRYGWSLASANWTTIAERVASVDNVNDQEILSRIDWYGPTREQNYSFFNVVGVLDESRVNAGLNVTSGANSLQENETYVWIGSQDAYKLQVNDTLLFNYTLWTYDQGEFNLSLHLRIAGFVDLDETAYALASGQYWKDGGGIFYTPAQQEKMSPISYGNLLIVSWERTITNLLDAIYTINPSYTPVRTEILVFLDREAVINPWDIGASQETITRVVSQIDNQVAEFGVTAYSNLEYVLSTYLSLSIQMRFTFLLLALPVFFVAWYVGSTVSDVSYNLRRREIGLLSARGFSSGQIFRLFLSESLLIGIVGGLIGVGLSYLLSPYFVTAIGSEFSDASPILTPEVIVLAIIFSTSLTLLSTFRPSRRAAKLPTVDALKEYMYQEEPKPYKQKWPWLAFLLGSYKITMFLIGISSLMEYFSGRPPATSNIFLTILFAAWLVVDSVLIYIGPLLFFWGFTKIFVLGSLGFQGLVTKAAGFLGDLGMLATRNVRRNPARVASVAFLVALIIGYGFQTVGSLASEEDYVIRQVNANVGADISVSTSNLTAAPFLMENITEISGVASTTLELFFYGETSFESLKLVAIEPQEWSSTAYFETEWFSGTEAATAFHEMTTDNHTIILERTIASTLNLRINDYVTLQIGSTTLKLRVVGFFGPEISGGSQPVFRPGESYLGSLFWSYVPANLYRMVESSVYASGEILVKLEAAANGTRVASQIRNLETGDINYVFSVAEQLEQRETNLLLSGTISVQRIGVIFAVVAASVATGLIAMVSLQERKKEVTIMNVRGLSYRQLITMLLAEHLSIIVFSTVLGVIVGLIIVHGSIVALNTTQYATLVAHRMIFPPDAVLTLAASMMLVFASFIIPLIMITKRYVSKLDRIVRA